MQVASISCECLFNKVNPVVFRVFLAYFSLLLKNEKWLTCDEGDDEDEGDPTLIKCILAIEYNCNLDL